MQRRAGEKVDRDRNWVSKSDLVRYLRCPYGFWRQEQSGVETVEVVDELQAHFFRQGAEFHEQACADAVPLAVTRDDLPAFFRGRVRLFSPPILENSQRKIFGVPDAIETNEGGLIPVEIKSHKDASRLDEWELAFYWLLLEPYRTRHLKPRGLLILRRGALPVEVEIELPQNRLDEVIRFVEEVRKARRYGVPPRICGCPLCRGPLREEILRSTKKAKSLSLIWGIGRTYAKHLETMGITSYDLLLNADPEGIVDGLRERGMCVSTKSVEEWRRHAQSYVNGKPFVFRECFIPDSYIALDTEYLPDSGHIWLAGTCLVVDNSRSHQSWWADNEKQQREMLVQLAELVNGYPNLPVVTWSGHAADIPALRSACELLDLDGALDDLVARHTDLFLECRNSIRFPIPEMSLSKVGQYFGVRRVSTIGDGLEAQFKYLEYRGSHKGGRRSALKRELIRYNRDDIDALIETGVAISELVS